MCQAKVYHSQEIDFCVILFIAAPFFISLFFFLFTLKGLITGLTRAKLEKINVWNSRSVTRTKNKVLSICPLLERIGEINELFIKYISLCTYTLQW